MICIEKLVKSSRILFYKKEITPELIDMHKLINSISDIFYNKIKYRIQFTNVIDDKVQIITSYDALTHILINLVSNAVDAITERGEIVIKVLEIDGKSAIIVKDTGKGISKERLEQIFEPFITDKPAGKGTGMGLYFVKTLVLKIGWKIEVFSEEGRGTEFMLFCGNVSGNS